MKLRLTRFMIMLTCFAVTACAAKLNKEQYSGNLFFGIGQYIFKLDMKSRDSRIIYNNSALQISTISRIDSDHLLISAQQFASTQGGRQQGVADRACGVYISCGRVFVLDLTNKTLVPLLVDASVDGDAVFLPRRKAVVFGGMKKGSTQGGLYWIQRSDPGDWHLIDTNASFEYPPVVVSDHAVVYRGQNGKVKLFDLANDRLSVLNISDCYPVLWRSVTQQLVCISAYASNSSYFYLISLDGKGKERLPIRYGPIVYIARYDLMLLSGVRGAFSWRYMRPYETSDLWSYNFKTREVEKFLPGGQAMIGAVYFPDKTGSSVPAGGGME